MKMVKSLLLGSAAALVAVTAGQAAELPVKAKPVQYVKICSLYGAGFYYMPGTDMCIKIGGWVRAEFTDESNGNLAWGPFNGNLNTRNSNDLTYRARGYITADAREQTAYGVARAYIDVGINSNDAGNTAAGGSLGSAAGTGYASNTNRAFLQWAGFTAGLSRSFYDFYNSAVQNYRAGYLPQEDTGDGGWYVWGYTAQLGGGVSATLSAESARMNQIADQDAVGAFAAATGASAVGGLLTGSLRTDAGGTGYGGNIVPDIVANIRVDQAWGSAQLMGAAHMERPTYYDSDLDATADPDALSGHPSDTWGWVGGAGAHINTPFITQGDYIEGEVNYTVGALKYLYSGEDTNMDNVQGGTQAYGVATDCTYGGFVTGANGTGCQLTSAWSAVVSYEHHWTPQWHESFTAAYMAVSYPKGVGSANAMLCSAEGDGHGVGITAVNNAGCDNDWSYWGAGTRLQWDVTKSFYLGVEAMYTELDSAKSSTGVVPGPVGMTDATLCDDGTHCRIKNEGNWAFTLRMHKDFLP